MARQVLFSTVCSAASWMLTREPADVLIFCWLGRHNSSLQLSSDAVEDKITEREREIKIKIKDS